MFSHHVLRAQIAIKFSSVMEQYLSVGCLAACCPGCCGLILHNYLQVHTSVCVPPKWRNPSKASYLSSSGTISGDDPGAVLARAASVSVPESNYYMHSSRARNWKRAWVLPIDREAAGEGTNANGFHMRTCSSSSLESVDIPVTG